MLTYRMKMMNIILMIIDMLMSLPLTLKKIMLKILLISSIYLMIF